MEKQKLKIHKIFLAERTWRLRFRWGCCCSWAHFENIPVRKTRAHLKGNKQIHRQGYTFMRYSVEKFPLPLWNPNKIIETWLVNVSLLSTRKGPKSRVYCSHSRLGKVLENCLYLQDIIFVEARQLPLVPVWELLLLTTYLQLNWGQWVCWCVGRSIPLSRASERGQQESDCHWKAQDLNCTWARTCSIG